jgi:hypothetical protein
MRAEDVLPDHINQTERHGVTLRKGTVAAFLANARLWCDPLTPTADREAVERDMSDALPALRALGLFEVLEVRHPALRAWLAAR